MKKTQKILASLGATVVLLGGVATYAVAVTPSGDDTVGGLTVRTVQTGATLNNSYLGVIANCPDSSWVAVAGGYYFDNPNPLVDDISIRADQRNENLSNNVQGWMVSAKADSTASGARNIVVEATCVKATP